MFRHNLHIFLQSIKKSKNTFFINLIGLSTGLACTLLIYLWVNDELHMDKFHENDKRLYQAMLNIPMPNGIETNEGTPGLLAQSLADELPEVEYAAAVIPSDWGLGNEGILSYKSLQLKADAQFVSQDYFKIFSYLMTHGNADQALSTKNSIVISDKIAEKFFTSSEKAIGKTIHWDKEIFNTKFTGPYLITGVFESPPSNSTEQFDLAFSYQLFFDKWGDNIKQWTNQNPHTYLTLKNGTDVKEFNKKIAGFIQSKDERANSTLFVRPYSDKYLFNKYENGVLTGGRIVYVRLFSIIALLILIIACINFMNLSTAKVSIRFKEVGIKKTIGAGRKSLVIQYLSESILMAFLSLIIALLAVEMLLPQFNQITGKSLSLNFDLNIMISLLAISLFTGLVSGSYPAFYLSGFNPVTVFKGKVSTSPVELWTRKGLVLFQFMISVILIVSVMVIYMQMQYIQSKNLGLNKDHILCFKNDAQLKKNIDVFLSELRKTSGVINASNSSNDFTGRHSSTTGGIIFKEKNNFRFASMDVNFDFFETMNIKLKAGRTFSKQFGSEPGSIILNEKGIQVLGIEDPVGKTVQVWGKDRQIVGIVQDFHFESLYQPVKPCFFRILDPNFNFANNIWVKIKAEKEQETIAHIQKLYTDFYPGLELEYRFLDTDFDKLYKAEHRVATLSRYFSGLAILISCLGLFGLAAFTAERRQKEIGIRKVLGLSGLGTITLLTHDFTKIVLTSLLISLPVSYFITKHWLDSFAYRINLQIWYFIGTGIITIFIVWITVGMHAVRAVLSNPVESLRYE